MQSRTRRNQSFKRRFPHDLVDTSERAHEWIRYLSQLVFCLSLTIERRTPVLNQVQIRAINPKCPTSRYANKVSYKTFDLVPVLGWTESMNHLVSTRFFSFVIGGGPSAFFNKENMNLSTRLVVII